MPTNIFDILASYSRHIETSTEAAALLEMLSLTLAHIRLFEREDPLRGLELHFDAPEVCHQHYSTALSLHFINITSQPDH
jgi:hypothetical protein